METIEEQIDVECPIRDVYKQWTRFEELPYFMSGVKEVTQHDTLLYWRGEILGIETEWESEIVAQEPDECIRWRSTSGVDTAGEVRLEPLGPNRTRVYLSMTCDTEGTVDSSSDSMEAMRDHVYYTLEDFKHFIEQREPELAGWPGEVYADFDRSQASASGVGR